MPPDTPNRAIPDWAAIARDYAAGALTVTEICRLHGISTGALNRRMTREGWPRRGGASSKRRPDITKRLLTVLDQKMTELETRMSQSGPASAADSERDARTLNTLARLFDKLKGLGQKSEGRKSGTGAKAAPAVVTRAESELPHADHADRLRHDLARRLEKLGRELGGD